MKRREQVNKLLTEIGAMLKRRKKHEVWELPNGKIFVRSQTPSDRRSDVQDLRDLRHALDKIPEHKEGQRREKKRKAGRVESIKYERTPSLNSLADQLRNSGIVEDALKEQTFILALLVFYQAERIKELNGELNTRWFNRLLNFWRSAWKQVKGLLKAEGEHDNHK